MPIRRQSCFADRKHFITNMDRQGRLWQKRKRKTWWSRLPKWLRGTITMALIVGFSFIINKIRYFTIYDVSLWNSLLFIFSFAGIALSLLFSIKSIFFKKKGRIVWKNVFTATFFGFVTGFFIYLFIFSSFIATNYVFADSNSYKRTAVVEYKRKYTSFTGRNHIVHFNVYFVFTDNYERFTLNDKDVFNKLDYNDKAFIILKDGLWGVPIVTDVDRIIN